MGRGQKRGRTQRRHFKEGRENVWKYSNDGSKKGDEPPADNNSNPNNNPSWQPFATKNSNFDDYYKEQCIVPIEEWDTFITSLRTPLPAAFRINASGQFFQDIQSQLENEFVKSLEAEITHGSEVEAIRPLPWYPGNLAWHLNFSRMQLRKNQTLERFHEFLKQENEIGNITRQEAVSMVPPLFLNVLPEHHVLDMCAAPGSKTFQLLEMMHQSTEVGSLPSGLVIANDVDVQRCNLLIHQTKRICSANLIVTNHEAQHFPGCHLHKSFLESLGKDDADGSMESNHSSIQGLEELDNSLFFDCVLCDVPCSGDGTLRKAPDIWRKWHSGMGNGLHVLQVHIAMRGLSLLKVGGRMVYSTCSMNPVENEAVVSEILYRCGASIELLDVSDELPDLLRRPGLRKWKVRDKGFWLSTFNDVPTNRRSTILPSMFPCGHKWASNGVSSSDSKIMDNLSDMDGNGTDMNSGHDDNCADDTGKIPEDITGSTIESANTLNTEECKARLIADTKDADREPFSDYPLERCMRIVPHDQNSGAFFIAVFQKVSALPVISEKLHNANKHSLNRRNGSVNANLNSGTENEKGKNNPSMTISGTSPERDGSDANTVDKQTHLKDVEDLLPGHNCTNRAEDGEIPNVGKDTQEVEKDIKGRLQTQGKWRGIDPVVVFNDDAAIGSIKDFYGISSSFPLSGHLVSRNEDVNRVKRIYYISKSVESVLKLNFAVGHRLKIASLGLKMFERQTSKDDSSPCAFRISSEGLPLLLPHMNKQILHASLLDFQRLLKYRNIKFAEFSDVDLQEKASKMILGCCVVVLRKGNLVAAFNIVRESDIAIVCWRGRTSLSVMVSEMDGRELLERISYRFKIETSVKAEDDEGLNGIVKNVSIQPAYEFEEMDVEAIQPKEAELMEMEAKK